MADALGVAASFGRNVVHDPVGVFTGMGILAGGVGLGVHALANPVDTAEGAYIGATVAGTYAGTTSTILGGGIALGVAGVGVAGAIAATHYSAKAVANRVPKTVAGVKSIGGGVSSFAMMTPGKPSAIAETPGRWAGNAVKTYGKIWDKAGPGVGIGVALGAGAIFGGVRALGSMALNTGVNEEAMSRSVEGSAYEQGRGSFGARSAGARVKSLGASTQNLVGGLHNRR